MKCIEITLAITDSRYYGIADKKQLSQFQFCMDLLDDDNGSERGETREWIKKRKERGMFITMKELKMHDIRGFKAMMRMGPEQFDQILQEIEPHICKKCTKMGVDGLIGCLIGFSTTSCNSAIYLVYQY